MNKFDAAPQEVDLDDLLPWDDDQEDDGSDDGVEDADEEFRSALQDIRSKLANLTRIVLRVEAGLNKLTNRLEE